MKTINYFTYFLILLAIISCSSESNNNVIKKGKLAEGQSITDIIHSPIDQDNEIDTSSVAKMKFEHYEYFFGEVAEGEILSHTFYFTNTGTEDLLIKDALSTCGCTVPTYPKNIIEVGGRDSILVKFDTKNKFGIQNKAISLIANTYPNKTIVYLKGKVKEKK